ncbi:unnamed protein product [Sphagnum jensenii]|uniref:MHD domain-containing protein n=1 Tax=Sphagnum jensenii TaxID=128206 RepID=A0ABP0VIS0_9BRYO
MIIEFLVQKLKFLKSYLGKRFTDDDVQSNFTLIYELMDECMDFGYPQVMATENLQQFISGGELPPTLATQATGAQLTCQITGMPECKFGLNDKLILEREGGARCVRLGKFDTDRTITFIPPHGQFELMKYCVITPAQPFKVFTSITEEGKARLMVNLKSSVTAVVDLLPSIREKKQWIRPPVTLDFQIPMYSCSGVQVRFLKVYDM